MDFKARLEEFNKKLEKINPDDGRIWFRRLLKRLPDISHLRNIVLFTAVASMVIFLMFSQRFSALAEYLPVYPLYGGSYQEGVVGSISQLNPLFSPVNSAETSATALIFSGLTKKDGNMKVIPDMAEKWDISTDGKTYTFYLKKGIKWHDGQDFNADDVIFTINTVQNPDARSPYLDVWKGVTVQKKNDLTVVFTLPNAYAPFLTLTNLPMVPSHILESVPSRNLKISEFSVKPVGTGPFSFVEIKKIRSSEEVELTANDDYYSKKPYIKDLTIKTYANSEELASGYSRKEVDGIERVPATHTDLQKRLSDIHIYQIAMPKYDAIFFNLRRGITKDLALRQAVAGVVDRKKIAETAYSGSATMIYAAIPPGSLGSNIKLKQAPDLAAAKKKLSDAGYVAGEDGILKKGTERATVRLVTSDDTEKSTEARQIAASIEQLGIEVKVERYPLNALIQDKIRPRDFDLLLISQNIGADPDLYAFWNSTQASDPGLNLSGLNDRKLDKYLEQARSMLDPNSRAEKYKQVEQIIWDNAAALFLVRPDYNYGVSNKVKGIELSKISEPKDRFWNIEDWFVLSTTDRLKGE